MPLLLLPLLVGALLLAWLVLLPVTFWQRYRRGTVRRRAVGWALRLNVGLLLASAGMLLVGTWITGYWIEAALLRQVAAGLATGLLVGLLGLALTRFEPGPRGLLYTPNRWLVLALTGVVAARLVFGLVRAWQFRQADAAGWLSQQGGLLAIGGLVLGYYLAYSWGLLRRLRRA